MENINRYFKDIAKASPLSLKEEYALALKIKEGDEEALNKLVKANLKFVVTVARQFQGRGISLEDLICEGNIGLVEAARRFDPSSGYRFISYAVFWIKQSICYAISNNRDIRLPMNRIAEYSKVRKMRGEALARGERVSDKEIAKALGVSVRDVIALDKAHNPSVSLDSRIGDEEDSCLEEIVRDVNADQDEGLSQESLASSLKVLLDSVLSKREAEIVSLSYGIGCTELDDEQIGLKVGVSGERVRQLKLKAIAKLRKSPKVLSELREYLG